MKASNQNRVQRLEKRQNEADMEAKRRLAANVAAVLVLLQAGRFNETDSAVAQRVVEILQTAVKRREAGIRPSKGGG